MKNEKMIVRKKSCLHSLIPKVFSKLTILLINSCRAGDCQLVKKTNVCYLFIKSFRNEKLFSLCLFSVNSYRLNIES